MVETWKVEMSTTSTDEPINPPTGKQMNERTNAAKLFYTNNSLPGALLNVDAVVIYSSTFFVVVRLPLFSQFQICIVRARCV